MCADRFGFSWEQLVRNGVADKELVAAQTATNCCFVENRRQDFDSRLYHPHPSAARWSWYKRVLPAHKIERKPV